MHRQPPSPRLGAFLFGKENMAGKSILRWDSFGPIPRDANRQFLSSFLNYFMTTDATGTPLTSPLSFTTGVTTLVVPAAAVQLTLTPSAALRISEEPTAAANYYVIPANTTVTVPCMTPRLDGVTTTGNLYIKGDSGSGTVNFFFSNV